MLFWRGKAAAILYAAIIFTVTFIAGTADVFAAVDDHTVQGKTPQGTVISLFDYWVNEQSSPDHGTSNNNSSGGINKSHSLKFSNGQGDGFNGWTGGKAPYSGMLDKTLDSSGYPSLAPDFGSWIFYSESLAYLFDDTKVEGKKAYNNVEGLVLTPADIAGRFTFTLTGVETTPGIVESAAPVPVLDGREMTEAVNGVTGEIDFGRIVLQASDFEGVEPGENGMRTRTFRYTITESGSFAGVTNDSNVSRDVNVTVKYSDSEKRFYVEDINEEEAFSFVNTYGIEDKTVDIGTMFRVDKILTGRDLKEGEFRFELLEMKDSGQSVIATGTNAAAEDGKAGSVDFGQITYSEPGEHDYVIREVVPAGGRDANTIFDTAGHSVHVSVKDNKDGTLSVTSSASEDDHIVFNNKQVKKDDPSKGDDPGANGGSHTNTGDSTPVGMIIAIMIAALCIIAVVIIISRRKSRK